MKTKGNTAVISKDQQRVPASGKYTPLKTVKTKEENVFKGKPHMIEDPK